MLELTSELNAMKQPYSQAVWWNNCGFLATSMKFLPMIEFDLVKNNSYGATWKNQTWPLISRWSPLHKKFLMNYCITCVFCLTAMSCGVFYVGRGTLPWTIDWLFKIQDGRKCHACGQTPTIHPKIFTKLPDYYVMNGLPGPHCRSCDRFSRWSPPEVYSLQPSQELASKSETPY